MRTVAVAVAAGSLLIAAVEAHGQPYPNGSVRIFTGFAAGSASDTMGRAISGPLAELWKQQVVVENRLGPGGIAAAQAVAKAPPDGHTLLLCSIATHGIGPVLQANLPYDSLKDFAPISRLGVIPNALIAQPSLPVKSVQELVAYAKANPGKLQYGSGGAGTSPHLTMEMMKSMGRINIAHVVLSPGVSSNEEVAAGRVVLAFNTLSAVLPFVKDGRVRAIAVTTARRNAQLPETPTLIESGFAGLEVTSWAGLCAPAGVPAAIVAKLNADTVKVLGMPAVRQRYAEQGAEVEPSTPEQFVAFIKAEQARWAKAAKDAGLERK